MAMLGKRRTARPASGTSGLTPRRGPATPKTAVPRDNEVMIERLAHDGRGVAHLGDGKTLFVEGALPGERVVVAVHRQRQRFDEAHIHERRNASAERVAPACEHFVQCGGCDLQHLALDAQRRHKRGVLVEHLERQGLALDAPPELLAASGNGYRRRARLGVKVDARGQVHLGFRAKGSHRLLDIHHCTILAPTLAVLLAPLHQLLATLEAPRHVGHIELLESDAGVTLVIRQLRDHSMDRHRWRVFADTHAVSLGWWLGREAPSLEWLGETPDTRYMLHVGTRQLTLGFTPGDFIQVNADVNQRLVDTALDWLPPGAMERVLDLFAGVGNLSLALACHATEVHGVEGSQAMVERLAVNARRNCLDNVTTRQANLNDEAAVRQCLIETPSLVVLDPPRDGAEAVCLQLAGSDVPFLLYISCDPATLARDAARLVQGGYRITRAAMADMFAHTAHLESMLLFERSG